ncbi:hypothetical protein LCGC14_2688050, partial [marine sediment metagenome]
IGYIVVMQSFFGTLGEKPLFWGVLGLLSLSACRLSKVQKRRYDVRIRNVSPSINSVLLIAMIVVLSFPLTHGIRLVMSDYYYRQAKLALGASYYNDAFYFFNKSVKLTPYIGYYQDEFGKALTQAGTKQKNEIYLKKAIRNFETLTRTNSLNSYWIFYSNVITHKNF